MIGVGVLTLFMGARYLQQCVVHNRNLKNGSIIKNIVKEVDPKAFKYEAILKELSDIRNKQFKEFAEESSLIVDQYLKEMREKAKKITEEIHISTKKDFQKIYKEMILDIKEFFKF